MACQAKTVLLLLMQHREVSLSIFSQVWFLNNLGLLCRVLWQNVLVLHAINCPTSAGKLNSDFSDLAQQLHHRNSAIDGENLTLEGYLPLWSNNRQQMSSGLSQAASQSVPFSQFPMPVSSFRSC